MPSPLAALDGLPRLGWVDAPSPVETLPALAEELGLAWLGAKRDDQLSALDGGSKVRKLDFILAAPPFIDASAWASVGAIGSGHLQALTAAAAQLRRRLDAYLFWEVPSPEVLENLGSIASGPTRLRFRPTRVGLFLRHPRAIVGPEIDGVPVVTPGGSSPTGALGFVRAGLELAAQVAAGELPEPDRLYAPLGSCGTVAGLALGLALGGLRTRIHAVTTVERVFTPRRTLDDLVAATRRVLVRAGVPGAERVCPAPVVIDRRQIGPGYGVPTRASRAACDRFEALSLEPVYSGKAMAALLARPPCGEKVLFWVTPRRGGPLPRTPDWHHRLPEALQCRLARGRGTRFTRRQVMVGVGVGAAAVATVRVTGYGVYPNWDGQVLAEWEAHVIHAAAEALLPPAKDGKRYREVPANVDRYLVHIPPHMQLEVHAALAAIEHGTTPLGGRWSRMTELPVAERTAWLAELAAAGGLRRQLYRGVRDLCMVGFYQQRATWMSLGYGGPWVGGPRLPHPLDALGARAGEAPRGWTPG